MPRRFNTADNYQFVDGNADRQPFIIQSGFNSIICRGNVIEVEHHEVFTSKLHKLLNSVIYGEPYQFAHQTAEYLVRVEEPSRNGAGRSAEFFLYGNYIGRLYPGDEIEVKARKSGYRYIAEKIYSFSTNNHVRPGLQIPAAIVRILCIVALVIVCALALYIYSMAQEGILTSLAIYGIIIVIAWIWFKNWLTSRFRRR